MDRGKQDWSWLPAQMPGVAKRITELRAKFGAAHINECWRRGVLLCEPGWFFAREGALSVGAPFTGDPDVEAFAASAVQSGQAMVIVRPPADQ